MSYILDALKKSEKERQIGQVPTLNNVGVGELTHVSKPFPMLLVIVIALLLVIAALLYFQLWSIDAEIPPDRVVSEVVEEAPVVVAVEPDVMAASPAPMKKEVVPERLDDESLKAGEVLITPTSRKEAAKTEKLKVAPDDDAPVPLLSETEYDFQDQLPEMHLDVHVYKKRRKGRFVLINMDKYREGQEIPGGVVIEEIVVDGVKMRYQDQRFLMPLN